MSDLGIQKLFPCKCYQWATYSVDFYTSGPFAGFYLSTFLLYLSGLLQEMSLGNVVPLLFIACFWMCRAPKPSLLKAVTVGLPPPARAGTLPTGSAYELAFLLLSGDARSPWSALRTGGKRAVHSSCSTWGSFPSHHLGQGTFFADFCGWLGSSKLSLCIC